jgi:serine/threonine protein kinase
VIGGYRVEEIAGRGGMAVVYRATQLSLDRRVALKLIAPEHAREPLFRERFLRESRLAAAVEHPNVLPVYEAGEDDGLLFIAMRFVDGFDLGAVLSRVGPLERADAVRIIAQIGGALDAAHQAGLVHRDVKPANILMTDDLQHAYLTDFGIARAADGAGSLTAAGMFVGTPDYAAPEQIADAVIDGRADVYALGCILFHALTGRPPFGRSGVLATLNAHVNDPPPRVSALVPDLSAFDSVIQHALEKQPDARTPTGARLAAEAAEAVARAAGEPVPRSYP